MNSLCKYWLQMNRTSILVLDACSHKNSQIRKFLRDSVVSSISSLNISAFYTYALYIVVPY